MGQTRKRGHLNEFDRRIIVRRYLMDLPRIQHGGGQGIVSVNGFNYNYDQDHEAGIYTIYGARPRRKTECFLLFVNEDKTAELHSMRQSRDCALQDNASSHNLLHAVLKLAKEKGATRIELTDVANKHLPYGKSFRLSNMYFLTSGRTWYETYGGFRPIAADEKVVERWRQRALTNRWSEVFACLQTLSPEVEISVDISDIDGKAEGSAMEVLRRIKELRSSFFADYMRDLVDCSRIGAMETVTWVADL